MQIPSQKIITKDNVSIDIAAVADYAHQRSGEVGHRHRERLQPRESTLLSHGRWRREAGNVRIIDIESDWRFSHVDLRANVGIGHIDGNVPALVIAISKIEAWPRTVHLRGDVAGAQKPGL